MSVASEKKLLTHIAKTMISFEKRIIENKNIIHPVIRPHIGINRRALVEAVKHARVDLKRMVKLHIPKKDAKPDRHKYAGFVSRWIAKTRPLYIKDQAGVLTVPAIQLNGIFSFWVFQSFLNQAVPKDLCENLVYSFHFREERGETLAFIAFTVEEISKLQN